MLIYVDGKLVPKEEAKVSVFDHGFLYGDGVFEGIRVYDGTVFRLKEHIDRLYESAHTLALSSVCRTDSSTSRRRRRSTGSRCAQKLCERAADADA